ncbi:type VI secretion system amidase immunity protein Tai4 [Telluria mixta]|uniref:Type VI secretion system amidase immunity protein Tai4 n=1 Tax=Telluria mixta TaxID=34071 RepID=A0ABT2BSQ2_9BURK|nr:type VI secretion system amidase immunity protein Tai4 [Telluria mixta]MCS0628151.1 type VI secretion system amidase immunity protein Tai4 [Telluria mixta]WEM93733.1 type VI secretion system amidase immunity protein Tai4 [Telluria mixta]
MKPAFAAAAVGALLACGPGAHGAVPKTCPAPDGTPMTANYSQKDLLKNWALSTCLAIVATDPALRADANATASAYMEFGHQAPEAYAALRELAENYAARRYSGSVEGRFDTMKCIDLFHSRELNSLATRLAKPSRER